MDDNGSGQGDLSVTKWESASYMASLDVVERELTLW